MSKPEATIDFEVKWKAGSVLMHPETGELFVVDAVVPARKGLGGIAALEGLDGYELWAVCPEVTADVPIMVYLGPL